ncbi:MAG: sugar phosphate isomerase/epimerase family protein, partial [Acidimicrobiales bacterium]
MSTRVGVVDVVFRPAPVEEAARRAADLGFAHIDVPAGWSGSLALPVGDRTAHPSPRAGCSCPAPPEGDGNWERAVRAYRANPGARMEPWPGSVVNTLEKVKAMLAEVPGLRLLVDTGHVACWGEDPVELLEWADHVQLRQARKGVAQTLEGDVDFAAVAARLNRLGYAGLVSV